MSRRSVAVAAVTAVALAMPVGCSSGSGAAAPSTDAATMSMPTAVAERPESTASLQIRTPRNGQVEDSSEVPVEIALRGARVVSVTSTDLQPDEGHLHLTLDERLVTMTSELDTQLADVPPGTHLLRVEFVAADHAPFDPRVIEQVAFEVKG